jgi:hypothetical protein
MYLTPTPLFPLEITLTHRQQRKGRSELHAGHEKRRAGENDDLSALPVRVQVEERVMESGQRLHEKKKGEKRVQKK